jgi:GntR family transcriptional regulator/MocR family aminotransferase
MPKAANLPLVIEDGGVHTLQEQICSNIRRSIAHGLIGPDHRLPSTRALAAQLGVSRTTVLTALEQLHAEGYLVSRERSGIFVAGVLPDQVVGQEIPSAPLQSRHPLLSMRGRMLAESRAPDRRLAGTEARAFRAGTPALDLFPARLWAQTARDCIRSMQSAQLDYASPTGIRSLREAIAEQVRTRGTRCDPQQVIVASGAQRALDLVFHLLLDPGDAVWMEEPGYPGARNALIAAGARIVNAPVDEEGMQVNRAAAGQIRLAYVTPSHQFPLGMPMSLPRRQSLLKWAAQTRSWIVEDDYDCEFRYQVRPLPCMHGLDPDGRVIYVGTFSKKMFPSLRLGFLIVPYDLVQGFSRARMASDLHPPVLEQTILAEFMIRGHYQRHLRRMQCAYAERLHALQLAIERCGTPMRLRPVHSGIHAVADLDGVDAESVCREAAIRNLEVMPLSYYYFGEPAGQNTILLGFGTVRPAAIRAAVTQLTEAIDVARRSDQFCADVGEY